MSWLMVFSACLAAVIVGGGITAVIVALVIGRRALYSPVDPVRKVLERLPDYPVGENGNLRGMEPETQESEEYEEANLRLD